MSLQRVLNVVCLLQVFVGLSMLSAAGVAFFFGDGDFWGILGSGAITLLVASVLYRITAFEGGITSREGFAIVTLAWTATASFGALPYLLTETLQSPIAAVFESMSGFTTTGATVILAVPDAVAGGHGDYRTRDCCDALLGCGWNATLPCGSAWPYTSTAEAPDHPNCQAPLVRLRRANGNTSRALPAWWDESV